MNQEATDEILRTQLRKAYEFAQIMHGRNRDDLNAPSERDSFIENDFGL